MKEKIELQIGQYLFAEFAWFVLNFPVHFGNLKKFS